MIHPQPATSATAPRWGLLIICVTQFMIALDVAVVNIALPPIEHALQFTTAELPWVIGAYTLSSGSLLLAGGRAADLFGPRTILITGLSLFTVASLVCGIASSPGELIGARFAQGVGAAMASPAALSLIGTAVAPQGRSRAIALYGMMTGLGLVAGQLLGGVLTSGSWRLVFWINIPFGLLLLALAPFQLTEMRGIRRRLDLIPSLIVTAALVCLLYAAVWAGGHSWGDTRVPILLACCVALLVVFVVLERRNADPIIPRNLLRSMQRISAYLCTFLLYMSVYPLFFFLTVFDQNVVGMSAAMTGLAFLPLGLGLVVAARIAQRLTRLGVRRLAVAGAALCVAGTLPLILLGPGSNYFSGQLAALLVIGMGAGLATVANTLGGIHGVEPAQGGIASGVLNTARQIGGTIGVAALPSIAANITGHLATHESTSQALSSGFDVGFAIAAGITVVAGLVIWIHGRSIDTDIAGMGVRVSAANN